jgi:hypothetical protein
MEFGSIFSPIVVYWSGFSLEITNNGMPFGSKEEPRCILGVSLGHG